ncbi:MAG: DMT family transporter [Candidatus Levyibacteriota bacterium]
MNRQNKRFYAALEGVAAFVLWSTLAIFFNIVKLPISVYVVFGSLVGLCLLYLYFFITKHGLPNFSFSLPLIGLFLIAAIKGVVWFKALTIYPVADAFIIHNLAPLLALLIAPIAIKEKSSFNHFVAIITGFIGLVVLLKFDHQGQTIFALGALFAFVAAICSAMQNVIQRKLIKEVSSMQQAFIFVLGQALGSVLFLPSSGMNISLYDIWGILFFGIVGTALPIILLSRTYKHLRSFEVATLGYTEPLLGAIWGSLFLHQPIVLSTAIGGILIFLSGLTAIKEK